MNTARRLNILPNVWHVVCAQLLCIRLIGVVCSLCLTLLAGPLWCWETDDLACVSQLNRYSPLSISDGETDASDSDTGTASSQEGVAIAHSTPASKRSRRATRARAQKVAKLNASHGSKSVRSHSPKCHTGYERSHAPVHFRSDVPGWKTALVLALMCSGGQAMYIDNQAPIHAAGPGSAEVRLGRTTVPPTTSRVPKTGVAACQRALESAEVGEEMDYTRYGYFWQYRTDNWAKIWKLSDARAAVADYDTVWRGARKVAGLMYRLHRECCAVLFHVRNHCDRLVWKKQSGAVEHIACGPCNTP